ncbi:MAG: germination protein YpeB [Eubacteriales bacterium]
MKDVRERNRRIMYIVAAVVIAGLITALIIVSVNSTKKERLINAQYQRAYEDIVKDIESLDTKMEKLLVANTDDTYVLFLMDVWRQTGDTEASITALPIKNEVILPFTQFITRVGDYCKSLSNRILSGEKLSEDDIGQIKSLRDSLSQMATDLKERWAETGGDYESLMDDSEIAAETLAGDSSDQYTDDMYVKLIYDGPFSESTENKEPIGLGDKELSADQAKEIAQEFLDNAELVQSNDMDGTIPCYVFEGKADDRTISIYITKTGGKVLYYNTDREWGMSAVPSDERYEQLIDIAKKWIVKKGFPECTGSYAQFYNGCAVINLVPLQDEVKLYPDLIKVYVDIETNEVIGFDANNYWMSHTDRTLDAATVTEEQARAIINPSLQITGVTLALIPKDDNKEYLCYEFKAKLEDTDCLVYINAKTCAEENILIIKHTNDGTLAQ